MAESCDPTLCYAYPSAPLMLDGAQYPSIHVADAVLVPVSAPGSNGRPLYSLERGDGKPIPYLGYSGYAYLAGMVERVISSQAAPPLLDLCYESALAMKGRKEIDAASGGPPVQMRTAKLRGPLVLGKKPKRRSP